MPLPLSGPLTVPVPIRVPLTTIPPAMPLVLIVPPLSVSVAPLAIVSVCVLPIDRERCDARSEEHTSELQSHVNLVCRLLLEKKKNVAHNVRHHVQQRQILQS